MDAIQESIFSYGYFEDLVRRFATTIPEFLLRHISTTHLASTLQRLHLLEALEIRFTVAIIGQMRVGKSTLLNALIGANLAPTGVTETTATINWFRYGQGNQCKTFRAHWADGSTVELPLEKRSEWIGTHENVSKTRCLDFFADTDFLRIANVVDTPGTRSVIESHESAIQGFLAEKLEEETLKYGGSADAVIYAINPVGHERDRDLLQLFGDRTRLPGASAYNSIAVVQKWEHLRPDPIVEVQKKCRTLKMQLDGKVAEVIPTSGLLARHVAEVPVDVWQQLADLCMRSTDAGLQSMLLSEQDFVEGYSGAGLDPAARRGLLDAISWKLIPLCVATSRKHGISEGETLRTHLHSVSGIPALEELLQRQFFSRARLIKASTTLRKAWEPCEIALQTLRKEVEAQAGMVKKGEKAAEAILAVSKGNPGLRAAKRYIEESIRLMERDVTTLSEIQTAVDSLKYEAKRNFELFDADITSLKLLEKHCASFSHSDMTELDQLFGQKGPEMSSRLGVFTNEPDKNIATVKARNRFDYWSVYKQGHTGDIRRICDHACNVLSSILDFLEI